MATNDPANPWSAAGWNVTQQGAYHQQHGAARAEARARDAGTSVGGGRPSAGGGKGAGAAAPGGSTEQKVIILKKFFSGWSPLVANVIDGARRVQRIVGWTGGQGQPPAIGQYLGPTGLVATAAEATDIRGATGAPGGGGGGGSGSSLMLEVLTAGETLSGHIVVYLSSADTVRAADSSNTARVGLIVGITTGAAINGDPAEVQIAGLMTEPSFAFTPGPVYFTATGVLTQTVPTTGFIQQVATAISATEIVVQLGLPIVIQ